MPMQLRTYTINKGDLHHFAQEWREKVFPLRVELGFRIHGAWIVENRNQFVWLISYEGSEAWEAKEREYYNSPARRGMDPDPARLIARADQVFVEPFI